MPSSITTTLLIFLAAAVIADLRSRRIPNLLSGPALALGLALQALHFGTPGFLASLSGAALMVGLLLLPFALGGIGGGDVKMMAAVGALAGPQLAVLSLAAGMTLGGAIMAIHLARLGRLRPTLHATATMCATAVLTGSLAPLRRQPGTPGKVALPYSVPLGLGTLAVLLLLPR